MKKVLLVSAYKLFLKRNTALLMRRGFQLFSATSGAEALKLHEEHHFDLILADLKLEDMGGCTLCSLIRKGESSQHVPIIITCHNIPGSIERVEQSSASAMLIKPVDPFNLLETVGGFIDMQIGRSKRVVLNVKVISKAHMQEFFCLSHDISNTGILFETDYQLALGSRITCQFTLSGICRIEAEGEITRFMIAAECKNIYGVKFIALPLTCRKAIDTYIASIPISDSSSQNIDSGDSDDGLIKRITTAGSVDSRSPLPSINSTP